MNYSTTQLRALYFALPYPLKTGIASVYGALQRAKRQGRYFKRHLAALQESQWFSNDRLFQMQFDRVKNFLAFAGRHSPYYSRIFSDTGFDPSVMQSLDDIRKLPLLSKQELRANIHTIVPDTLESFKPVWAHTSGTTGRGLRFPESLECFQREYAFRTQSYSWGGADLGTRWAFCAGHPITSPDRKRPPFWIHDLANNMLMMSSYHLSEKNLPLYIDALRRFKPTMLAGYPSSIYLLALANFPAGRPLQIPCTVTSSETLFDFQRETIQRSFGGKVISYYGNAERAAVISQCERGTYHLRLEHSYVELLDDHGNPCPAGAEGQLVCTAFGNWATPLVRYQVGDVAVFNRSARCECGRGGVIVDRIVGRTEDYIITPEGRFVGRLDHLFKDATKVRMAQIVQERPGSVTLRIVKETGYTEKDEAVIQQEARLRLGSAIRIMFEYVTDIPLTKNGKFRFIVSSLARDQNLKIPMQE